MKSNKETMKKTIHTEHTDYKKEKKYNQFIQDHRIQKSGGDTSVKITNTRIGNTELEIYGGKYSIPDNKYKEFLQLYYREIFVKNQPEYLTETQLEKGAILIDVDLRHDYSITTRQYSPDHISDLNDLYLAVLKEVFQFDETSIIESYIFQKPNVNRLANDNITKDGAHIIFTIQCDHITQQLIRKKILEKIEDVWNAEELKLINTWDKVFDEGISQGGTNWQLVGSRKPGNEAYRLTGIYTSTFDPTDQEFSTVFADASTFDMETDIYKLSARYPNHYEPFMTNSFLVEYNAFKGNHNSKRISTSNTQIKNTFITSSIDPLSIRSQEQLDNALKQYVDNIPPDKYKEYEAYAYTMTLPPKYYDKGSYNEWFCVGCALRNTSYSLFIVWVAFSAQMSTFSFTEDVQKMWEQWQTFDYKRKGLTFRSIYYWSKTDAPEKFNQVRKNTLEYYLDLSLDNGLTEFAVSDKKSQGATDYDLSLVLRQMKKDEFVCSDIESNTWYQYRNHRWIKNDSGTSLRMVISTDLRSLYGKKLMDLGVLLAEMESEEEPKYKFLKARQEKAFEIYAKLGRTSDKRNIMTEAKDLFYDEEFNNKIDTNPELLCCANGVWDFSTGVFRDGKPDDYISISTKYNYYPITDKDASVVEEINDFMNKLFPKDPGLLDYMWSHLASTLIGTAMNQTFNNYLGGGRNGKSVLVTLMTKVLGEYKGELPLTAVCTSKRTAVGGLSPEIAALKGKRYVIMQEPRQGEIINEGILKELTSGLDVIQARGLYKNNVSFMPQFKLAVCANTLPEIKAMDHGTWRRIRVVPFKSLFTENPVEGDPFKPYQFKLDPTIDQKFDSWKSVFLAMLVKRAIETKGAVADCETVLQASNEYKKKQDVMSQFIEERIERAPGQWLTQTHANQGFKLWHEDNFGSKGPQPKELHAILDREFGSHIKKFGWKDIRLVFDNNDGRNEIDPNDADY